MHDALTLLDHEWETYRTSKPAASALRRWRMAQVTPGVPDMAALLAATQDPADPDTRDRLLYRLALRSRADRDACRVVLQAVRPGLNGVAHIYRRRWGWQETASMTVAAAIERIATYPPERTERPAANIVRDVQNRLHRTRLREDMAQVKLGRRVPSEELAGVASPADPSASAELVQVVGDALETLRLSQDQASLIVGHRVFDVPTEHLAAERGHRPGTVRRHRQRAEDRLALIIRSTYGVRPAVAG